MVDFEARQKQFKGWENEKRIALMGKLITLIREHTQVAITAATIKADYETVRHHYGVSDYVYTLYQAFGGVRDWADREGIPGPIAYVFSQRAASNGELEVLRQRIYKDTDLKRSLRVGSWTIQDIERTATLTGSRYHCV